MMLRVSLKKKKKKEFFKNFIETVKDVLQNAFNSPSLPICGVGDYRYTMKNNNLLLARLKQKTNEILLALFWAQASNTEFRPTFFRSVAPII